MLILFSGLLFISVLGAFKLEMPLKIMLFLQNVVFFIFPAIACGWLFSDNYKDYLHLDSEFPYSIGIFAAISMIVAVPLINFTADLNSQMVFPESLRALETWMRTTEDTTNQLLEKILYVHHWSDLVFNIIIVCILAAVGEELIFRGLLQNLFGKILKNHHIIIWMVAFIFSAIHFQFYGFLPRLLMGAYLGYLLYYTNNLWIPIIAHFTNNFVSVVLFTIFQDSPAVSKQVDTIGTGNTGWLAIASLALFSLIFSHIVSIAKKR
jgi:membrane protease YdiL (CAAX protease family)